MIPHLYGMVRKEKKGGISPKPQLLFFHVPPCPLAKVNELADTIHHSDSVRAIPRFSQKQRREEPKSQRKDDGENLRRVFPRGRMRRAESHGGVQPSPEFGASGVRLAPVTAGMQTRRRRASSRLAPEILAGNETTSSRPVLSPVLCSSPATIFSRHRRVASSAAAPTPRSPAKEPIIGNWISAVVRPPPRAASGKLISVIDKWVIADVRNVDGYCYQLCNQLYAFLRLRGAGWSGNPWIRFQRVSAALLFYT